MKMNRFMFYILAVLLSLLLSFVYGCCTKKAMVESSTAENQIATAQPSADESSAEAAAREKALKEQELRDQERQRLEKEKADREAAAGAERERAVAASSALSGMEFIHFDFDKYTIKPDARETLKKIADKLKASSEIKLLIEGNCDERGTVEYNLALGERRANAAMKYLVDLGIDGGRITTLSNGKEKPMDPGHTEEAWAKNRNDHFIVKK